MQHILKRRRLCAHAHNHSFIYFHFMISGVLFKCVLQNKTSYQCFADEDEGLHAL